MDQAIIRPIVYYEFLQGHSARTAAANICAAFKKDVVHHSTVSRWYKRFAAGEILFEDRQGSGRPSEWNDERLLSALQMQPNATSQELATTIGCTHTTVIEHLQELDYRSIFSRWVPHELRLSDKTNRMHVAESLLLRPHRKELLEDIVTGDEIWVLYVNYTRKRHWTAREGKPTTEPKADLHEKKVLLCCWWDCGGMIYWELLDSGTPVTVTVYANQLQKVADVMRELRPKRLNVFLLHDNARPHVATEARQKIMELGWEVLPHPAYSADLAPSDYHLFRALKNHLSGKKFDERRQVENGIDHFFSSQPPEFWKRGIEKLPERWAQVIDNNGDYIVD
nr:Transposase domain containing protein [Haemonchus contortus]